MSNLLQVEKVSKEDYHQWLSNPVTKAMTAQLTNELMSLNSLTSLPNPLTLEKVHYQLGKVQGLTAVLDYKSLQTAICKKGSDDE
jgi:hypothetical protein